MKATTTLSVPGNVCGGKGYIVHPAHWDSGWPDTTTDCGGCLACRPALALAVFFGAFDRAPALAGFAALAAVGNAVAVAAAPAAGVVAMVAGAMAAWNTPVKGGWYEVTGKRGKAKDNVGLVGECIWVGEKETWRYGRLQNTTARVGLKPVGATEAVFVPASAVTRVPVPAAALPAIAAKEAAVAAKAARTPAAAGKGDVVKVTHGPCAGNTGRVFWVGSGKHGARFGLDTDLARKKGRCPTPLWVDAVDCELATAAPPKVTAPAKVKAAPAPAIPPAPVKVLDHATPPAPEAPCRGIHHKDDGSYWVSDAKGIPVARVCSFCKEAKLKKYRPEIFTNANYTTTEVV